MYFTITYIYDNGLLERDLIISKINRHKWTYPILNSALRPEEIPIPSFSGLLKLQEDDTEKKTDIAIPQHFNRT